jgi:Protein of unknown function (DUF1361)
MTVVPRAVLLVALVATTGLTTVLGITDPSAPTVYPTRFLIWNLALAWVPLVMAVGFAALSRSVWQLPWLLGWLAFLPNTVYLVTDLSHLGEGVDVWRHVLQYGFAAWTGIMLGVVSLRLVHARTERELLPGVSHARCTSAEFVQPNLRKCSQTRESTVPPI